MPGTSAVIARTLLAAFPVATVVGFAALYWPASTRPLALALLGENRPVEMLTFVTLLAGGLFGLGLVHRLNAIDGARTATVVYALFSIGLILVAMEEIAWGQWFLGFETPASVREINAQNELTLHNLEFMQGHNTFLRLAFGIGGLAGYGLGVHRAFRLAAPPRVLLPWFVVIVVAASVEAALDLRLILDDRYGLFQSKMPEVTEMLIGFAGLLYVVLNRPRIAAAAVARRDAAPGDPA